MATSDSLLTATYTEEKWVAHISEKFMVESPIDTRSIPISVWSVPRSISSVKPEAYAPQVVALGPYHHHETQLYQMERYKIAAVKSFLSDEQNRNFESLFIRRLKEIGQVIRACYHKYIQLNSDTLAWIIAVDGLFLLYILSKDTSTDKKTITDNASVCTDIMMVENQIPSILLRDLWKTLRVPSSGGENINDDEEDEAFCSMMQVFCESRSPFQPVSALQPFTYKTSLHLLDLLYKMIVIPYNKQDAHRPEPEKIASFRPSVSLQVDELSPMEMFQNIGDIVKVEKSLVGGRISSLSKPIEVIEKLPWPMISNLIGLKTRSTSDDNPEVKEIQIPSVSKLCKLAGVDFQPTKEGVRSVEFNEEKAVLYLPVITLNSNSEVILRNLVAYELANASGSSELVLAKYVDLLSGIIDTKEDAEKLKNKGIITGSLSSTEIATMFNGMNQSTEKVYNEITVKINDYYWKKPKVRAIRFMKKNLYGSWRALTVLSTIVLLLLLVLQATCDVYGCSRLFS